jgi:hypothetical protein
MKLTARTPPVATADRTMPVLKGKSMAKVTPAATPVPSKRTDQTVFAAEAAPAVRQSLKVNDPAVPGFTIMTLARRPGDALMTLAAVMLREFVCRNLSLPEKEGPWRAS